MCKNGNGIFPSFDAGDEILEVLVNRRNLAIFAGRKKLSESPLTLMLKFNLALDVLEL